MIINGRVIIRIKMLAMHDKRHLDHERNPISVFHLKRAKREGELFFSL